MIGSYYSEKELSDMFEETKRVILKNERKRVKEAIESLVCEDLNHTSIKAIHNNWKRHLIKELEL